MLLHFRSRKHFTYPNLSVEPDIPPNPSMLTSATIYIVTPAILLHIEQTPFTRTLLCHPPNPVLGCLQRYNVWMAVIVAIARIAIMPGYAVIEAGIGSTGSTLDPGVVQVTVDLAMVAVGRQAGSESRMRFFGLLGDNQVQSEAGKSFISLCWPSRT